MASKKQKLEDIPLYTYEDSPTTVGEVISQTVLEVSKALHMAQQAKESIYSLRLN